MYTFLEPFFSDYGLLTLFALAFLAATLLPLGSEWLLVLLLQQGDDPLKLVVVAGIGNYLGSCTNYLIGLYGSDFLIKKLLRMDDKDILRAEQYYKRYGVWSLLFAWLPVIGDPLCVIGGIFKMNFWLFSLLVFIGKLGRYSVIALLTLQFI